MIDRNVDRNGAPWIGWMRGATVPVGVGEKTGVEEAVAPDVDEGWQIPNKEDGGPVDDGDAIDRVLLARNARMSHFPQF